MWRDSLQWMCSSNLLVHVCVISMKVSTFYYFTGSDDDIKKMQDITKKLSELEIASGLNLMLCHVPCRHTFSEYNCVSSRPSQVILALTQKINFLGDWKFTTTLFFCNQHLRVAIFLPNTSYQCLYDIQTNYCLTLWYMHRSNI